MPLDDEITFVAFHNGDPSVGINGEQAEIRMWIDPANEEMIQAAKELLQEAFTKLWDFKAHVMTQAEAERDM